MGFDKIIFKGDAKNVVELIQRADGVYSNCGHLIQDTRILLSNIQQRKFGYVKRDVNYVTHHLEKATTFLEFDSVYIEGVPECIQSLVISYANQ